MPVINGCKYSCEFCIRGHRATSCAHTDRILIEVRKPGRPLESCGHEFATCTCGKITELLSMGTGRSILFLDFEVLAHIVHEVLPSPASAQAGQPPNATLVVTSPPLASVTTKSKERKQSGHRVRRNSKSRKGKASPASTSNSQSSREHSTILEDSGREVGFSQQSYAYQDQMYPQGAPVPGSQQSSYGQYAPPTCPTMQSSTQGPRTFVSYQTDQKFHNQHTHQMAFSQQQADYSVSYSSKIEDIARAPNGQQDDTDQNQPYIRSQYITARHESVWRETH